MKWWNWALLALTPLALLAALIHASPVVIFGLSIVAIIPLAKLIGDATDELAAKTSPAVGGLLNVTFGNATELIIGIFALQAGLVEVVKASITGSIIGNLLLVLGMAMFLGGTKKSKQVFNVTAAKASASMLLLATTALIVPAFFAGTSAHVTSDTVMLLSILVSILMMGAYIASLFFSLRTHKHLFKKIAAESDANWTVPQSLAILFASTIAVSLVSEVLVHSIEPIVEQFGWTQLFIGVIVVAVIGNVAEHMSAIRAALDDKMDLTLSIAVGSATQIVMFVAPVLVLLSLVLGHQMNLIFTLFELIVLIFSVLVTNAVIEDGESNWFEGIQLLFAYVIMAVAFFLYV